MLPDYRSSDLALLTDDNDIDAVNSTIQLLMLCAGENVQNCGHHKLKQELSICRLFSNPNRVLMRMVYIIAPSPYS